MFIGRQAHFCLPCIGQDTGELFLKGPLVEAFYPRQTRTAEKASTVDTGYTTVGSALNTFVYQNDSTI